MFFIENRWVVDILYIDSDEIKIMFLESVYVVNVWKVILFEDEYLYIKLDIYLFFIYFLIDV